VTLEVSERRSSDSKIAIGDFEESLLQVWTRSGIAAADVERALKPVLEKRREVAAVDRRVAELEAERRMILEDQQRLRENLKVLGRSAQERQLLERYTRQLDQQENRLESLRRELAAASEERNRARQELARLIGETAFEVKR
jgi:chromosome segregation ATPase